METRIGLGGAPALSVYSSDDRLLRLATDERIAGLRAEADAERLVGPREGLRQHIGHAIMALGRAIHGLEPERPARPALEQW